MSFGAGGGHVSTLAQRESLGASDRAAAGQAAGIRIVRGCASQGSILGNGTTTSGVGAIDTEALRCRVTADGRRRVVTHRSHGGQGLAGLRGRLDRKGGARKRPRAYEREDRRSLSPSTRSRKATDEVIGREDGPRKGSARTPDAGAIAAAQRQYGTRPIDVHKTRHNVQGGADEAPGRAGAGSSTSTSPPSRHSWRLLPITEAQGVGAIVNISSLAATRWTGYPYVSYYASKRQTGAGRAPARARPRAVEARIAGLFGPIGPAA